ncbi:hypothetical protein C8J57DRAFT_1528297 [Mycena rebaudengoi]|nr:hypothetical protein C8J57DRAFT_1528297 [Mycena rebaudengoi]
MRTAPAIPPPAGAGAPQLMVYDPTNNTRNFNKRADMMIAAKKATKNADKARLHNLSGPSPLYVVCTVVTGREAGTQAEYRTAGGWLAGEEAAQGATAGGWLPGGEADEAHAGGAEGGEGGGGAQQRAE